MNCKAFTLVEIIIVVVMIGILASIAVPKLITPNDRIISSEGQHLLTVLLSAQKRYKLESATSSYATDIASLDVEMTPKFFTDVRILDGTGANNAVASMTRSDNSYTISIGGEGANMGIIFCSGAGCASIKCNKGAGGNQCNQ